MVPNISLTAYSISDLKKYRRKFLFNLIHSKYYSYSQIITYLKTLANKNVKLSDKIDRDILFLQKQFRPDHKTKRTSNKRTSKKRTSNKRTSKKRTSNKRTSKKPTSTRKRVKSPNRVSKKNKKIKSLNIKHKRY